MKDKRSCLRRYLIVLIFLLCILDSKTVIEGANAGIDLCINSAIPSLFPLMIIAKILCVSFMGHHCAILKRIGQVFGIPAGAEHLLINGFLGGYPIGAQTVYDLYVNGTISQYTARRLLAFTNNAGPAFIFGILAESFSSPLIPWIIWMIQILSALYVGLILSSRTDEEAKISGKPSISLVSTLNASMRSMATVCGWIVVFRIIIQMAQKWILYLLPNSLKILIIGALELTNGCLLLSLIGSESVRFIIACGMISFGGCCVWIQTASVVKALGTSGYIWGKVLQTGISVILATVIQYWLFQSGYPWILFTICGGMSFIIMIVFLTKHCKFKKTVEI